MALCKYCGLEMTVADGCTDVPIVISGRAYQPVRHGEEVGMAGTRSRCHDCNVVPGSVHHHGCDMEDCPDCGRQSISCGCVWAGEEHLSEDWMEGLKERFLASGSDE
jgi:hypothetical protein